MSKKKNSKNDSGETTGSETTSGPDVSQIKALFEEYNSVDEEYEKATATVAKIARDRSGVVEKIWEVSGHEKKFRINGQDLTLVVRPLRNGETTMFFRGKVDKKEEKDRLVLDL